jgi:hypothetical protein
MSYGAIPSVERAHRARAAPMIALMGLAAVAVVAIVTLTTQSRAVEMVAFPQDDLGILKEMVSASLPPSLPIARRSPSELWLFTVRIGQSAVEARPRAWSGGRWL